MTEYLVELESLTGWYFENPYKRVSADSPGEAKEKYERENPSVKVVSVYLPVWEAE